MRNILKEAVSGNALAEECLLAVGLALVYTPVGFKKPREARNYSHWWVFVPKKRTFYERRRIALGSTR